MVEITSTENPPVWWPGWDKFILRRFLSGTETETETKSLLRLCFCLRTKIPISLRFCICFCICIRIFFVFVQIFCIRPFPDCKTMWMTPPYVVMPVVPLYVVDSATVAVRIAAASPVFATEKSLGRDLRNSINEISLRTKKLEIVINKSLKIISTSTTHKKVSSRLLVRGTFPFRV